MPTSGTSSSGQAATSPGNAARIRDRVSAAVEVPPSGIHLRGERRLGHVDVLVPQPAEHRPAVEVDHLRAARVERRARSPRRARRHGDVDDRAVDAGAAQEEAGHASGLVCQPGAQ